MAWFSIDTLMSMPISSPLTIQVKCCISDRRKRHYRSRDVIRGQLSFLGNNSWVEQDTGSKTRSSCLSRQDGSTDMQHDLSGQVMTLTWGQISNLTFWGQIIYWSEIEVKLRSFDASWWDKHGGVRIVSLSRFELELLQKKRFPWKSAILHCMTSGGQTVGLSSKRLKVRRTSVKRAVECFSAPF